jgi:hypothetical protein
MREGVNLPNRGGRRGTRFSVLVVDALSYSAENHKDHRNFRQRLELADGEFGQRVADSLTPLEIADWLEEMADARDWEGATYNRVKAAMSKAYKLGLQNSKVFTKPRSPRARQERAPGPRSICHGRGEGPPQKGHLRQPPSLHVPVRRCRSYRYAKR